ncbi:Uncharacterised protein [Bordetella pertussis]|nr:Uncharacterised protein [Bordetella pertussis]
MYPAAESTCWICCAWSRSSSSDAIFIRCDTERCSHGSLRAGYGQGRDPVRRTARSPIRRERIWRPRNLLFAHWRRRHPKVYGTLTKRMITRGSCYIVPNEHKCQTLQS